MKDKFYFDRHETRMKVLEQFSMAHAENWQSNTTPLWVARDMTRLVEDAPDLRYVVLFNIEFLEALIFDLDVPRDRIMFMADNKYEAAMAMTVYGVKTYELPVEVREPKRAIELVAEKITKAFYKGGTMPVTNNLVVFGNPPYQRDNKKEGGKTSHASPIYHLFVETIIDCLTPRFFSFIIPSRWMRGGRGLDRHRARMMDDRRLRIIKHFPGSFSVFEKGVEIKGGVNYFLWDREYQGKCCFNGRYRYLDEYSDQGIILIDGEASSILDKVRDLHQGFIDSSVLSQTPFGLISSWNEWCAPTDTGAIKCYRKGSEIVWVNHGYKDDASVLPLWKVAVSEANNGATNADAEGKRRVIGKAFLIGPNEICTQSYMVVKCFPSKVEAENFSAYMGTMFFRFLLGLHMPGQHVNKDKFSWVPDMKDYTRVWTDADLYKKFGLTSEEIAYIESKIKEIA